jgi:hypothetical protein
MTVLVARRVVCHGLKPGEWKTQSAVTAVLIGPVGRTSRNGFSGSPCHAYFHFYEKFDEDDYINYIMLEGDQFYENVVTFRDEFQTILGEPGTLCARSISVGKRPPGNHLNRIHRLVPCTYRAQIVLTFGHEH